MGPGPRFELGRKAPQASMLPSYTTPAAFPCKTCSSAFFTEFYAWLRYTHSKHLIFVCGRFFRHHCTLRLYIQSPPQAVCRLLCFAQLQLWIDRLASSWRDSFLAGCKCACFLGKKLSLWRWNGQVILQRFNRKASFNEKQRLRIFEKLESKLEGNSV